MRSRMNSAKKNARAFSCGRLAAVSCVLGLFLAHAGNSQERFEPPRTVLTLRCPDYVVAPHELMTLEADLVGAEEALGLERAKQITYRWEIAGGYIVLGQGTSRITFKNSTSSESGVALLDVKVILDGLPPYANSASSCTIKINSNCPRPSLFDQYEDIPTKDELARLDRLATYLINGPSESVIFFIVYAGRKTCLWEAKERARGAMEYLTGKHKLHPSRVIGVDGGFREKLNTEIFIAPCDSCGPYPTPSLTASKVHVSQECTAK